MEETTKFEIGAEASCSDGVCGQVSRVVVDPLARVLTHLVVEPKHRVGLGRLVPLDLVVVSHGEIQLRATMAEFDQLAPAEETHFLPGTSDEWGYDGAQVYSWPYFDVGLGPGPGLGVGNVTPPVVFDKVPLGEVMVRRGEQVHATDGDLGKVQGLLIDPADHHVTHFLLQEGHLLGRKEVAIPISAVTGVSDGIQLNLTKDQVQDLPPLDWPPAEG